MTHAESRSFRRKIAEYVHTHPKVAHWQVGEKFGVSRMYVSFCCGQAGIYRHARRDGKRDGEILSAIELGDRFYRQIADDLETNVERVKFVARSNGIRRTGGEIRPLGRTRTVDDAAVARDLLNLSLSYPKIAERNHCSQGIVDIIRKRHGLSRRKHARHKARSDRQDGP